MGRLSNANLNFNTKFPILLHNNLYLTELIVKGNHEKVLHNGFKVAPRVEKTEVFRKGWNFANRTYFASCIMRKHYFLLWTKETAFFPYFYHGIIFYSAELFDCAVNFKFYLNIFIFLNINTNQTSNEQYLN